MRLSAAPRARANRAAGLSGEAQPDFVSLNVLAECVSRRDPNNAGLQSLVSQWPEKVRGGSTVGWNIR